MPEMHRNRQNKTKQNKVTMHTEKSSTPVLFYIIEYIDFLEILCLTYLYFFVATGMNVGMNVNSACTVLAFVLQ